MNRPGPPCWLVFLALGSLGAAHAPAGPAELQRAESAHAAHALAQHEAVAHAAEAAAQAARLAEERVAAAARLRGAEEATGEAAARVAALAERARAAEARLGERAAAFRPLLPILERLSIYPVETLIAIPGPPEQAVRGVLVLATLSRQLEREAAALRAEQASARALGDELRAALPRLTAAQAAQAREAAALDERIVAARGVQAAAEDAASQAARRAGGEAARADGLRAALARIEAGRDAAASQARAAAEQAARLRQPAEAADARVRQEALARPAGPGLGDARATLTSPVAGTVVRGFGAPSDAGPANGMAYGAPPAARVVSPCDGRIVFSGPFRSYGRMLIVDCGGGYHAVLAGMDRLDGQTGQPVRAGEPVGVMPGWDPRAGGGRPELYVELRKGGDPVNPAPFLRAKS